MNPLAPRWRATAVALGIAAALSLPTSDVHALALGRITVQSALGEPLRADIDVPEITPQEAETLKATVAPPDAFRAAGLEYNPALSNLQISLEQRADGKRYLRLTSTRPINEPFIDLILQANWAAGRTVRDYTLLLDPPAMRARAPAAPNAAQVGAAPATAPRAAATTAPVVPSPAPQATTLPAAAPSTAAAPQAKPKATPAAKAAAAEAPSAAAAKQVTVQAGDTAGRLASNYKPATVSLDQMLVALLRANPDAFINGNVNLIKAGVVVEIPSADAASSVSAAEARRTVVAQSRDFNEFRKQLASSVPTTQVASADRQASGKLQAKVEDKAPSSATPDKLTLSKGAIKGQPAAEEKIAKARQAEDAASRVAELNKNITELNKLSAASAASSSAPVAAAPSAAASQVGIAVPATPATAVATAASAAVAAAPASAPASAAAAVVSAAASTPSLTAEASATATASAESTPAAVVAAPVKPPVVVAPPAPVAQPSLIDDLLENPLIPAAGAGVLGLLGFLWFRSRQRKNAGGVDSSFLESRLQPDSFFGASGGQRIDTSEGVASGSSMVYSPSQLDAAGDVDPVAEADVYLAYGRDLQAEEILKEALRTNPNRVAIHGKLLEIYAKRRDVKTFEVVATQAHSLTHGAGAQWEQICDLGKELDPANPLYKPGGAPQGAVPKEPTKADMAYAGAATIPLAQDLGVMSPSGDVDLDLDFSLGDDAPPSASQSLSSTAPMRIEPAAAKAAPVMAPEPDFPEMEFTEAPQFEPPKAVAPAPTTSAAAPAEASSSGMMEFDMGSLSLDLESSSTSAKPPTAQSGDTAGSELTDSDPLATKLALAEEFSAIGDNDGARSLAQEVVASGTGALKAKAQRFLSELT